MFEPSFYLFSFIHHQFSSIAVLLSNSIGSAADTNISGIAEFLIFAKHPAPVPPIHITTSRCTNFLTPSHRITRSDIPAWRSTVWKLLIQIQAHRNGIVGGASSCWKLLFSLRNLKVWIIHNISSALCKFLRSHLLAHIQKSISSWFDIPNHVLQ